MCCLVRSDGTGEREEASVMNAPATWGWILFAIGLSVLLAIDLFVHRGGREESWRSTLGWSVIWIAMGLGFGGFVWWMYGAVSGQEYLAAYLIEQSLSLDNLFVFLLIFQTLSIPHRYQHTALSWGIFGALIFRAIFIFAGAAALQRWAWLEFIFAVFLVVAAIHVFRESPTVHSGNRLVSWLTTHLRVSKHRDTAHFFLRENGVLVATPLFVAVVGLELSDIIFAVDSVPAALAITREPFLVYTSNAFAILGLRAMYLLMARSIAQLQYLHYGLAAVLGFVGLKMAADRWVTIQPLVSVGVVAVSIMASVGVSLWKRPSDP